MHTKCVLIIKITQYNEKYDIDELISKICSLGKSNLFSIAIITDIKLIHDLIDEWKLKNQIDDLITVIYSYHANLYLDRFKYKYIWIDYQYFLENCINQSMNNKDCFN